MTRTEAVELDRAPQPQGPPRLVDVKVEKPRVFQVSIFIPIAVGFYFLSLLSLWITGALDVMSALIAFGGSTFLGLIAVVLEAAQKRNRCLREFRDLISKGESTAAASRLAQCIHSDGMNYLIIGSIKRFVRHENVPAALRVHWTDTLGNIEPMNVSFNPVSLDETDDQFVELAESTGACVNSDTHDSRGLRVTEEEAQIVRRVRRHLRLVWAWPGLLIFLFIFVSQAIQSYQQRTVTVLFGLYVALVVARITFGAADGLFESPLEWLIVPGGLLKRKQAKDAARSDVELLTPHTAMVVAVQTRKQAWTVFITDGNRNEPLLLTALETEMLFRAWLSPIPPPSVDKLIDLT